MKNKIYYMRLVLAMLLCLTGLEVSAYDIAVKNDDGNIIYYNYINNGTELEVAGASFSGHISIPSTVTYKNRTRNVTRIGKNAFNSYMKLSSIDIPNSVVSIGESAFAYCTNLSSIDIPNSVTHIETDAFFYCRNLKTITIGSSVRSIGASAFGYCDNITLITSRMENPCETTFNCFTLETFYNAQLYVPQGMIDKYKNKNYWNKFIYIE